MRQLQQLLQLATLFDCVEDILVWIKDRDGRYCWVNRAFLINYAMDRLRSERPADTEGVLGKTDYDLSPTFLADQFRLDDEQVLTGKRIVNRIELVGQPEGLTVWSVTNKIPLTDTDGAIIGTAGITRRLDTPKKEMVPGTEFGPVLAYLRDHYHAPITNQQLARNSDRHGPHVRVNDVHLSIVYRPPDADDRIGTQDLAARRPDSRLRRAVHVPKLTATL